MTDRLERGYRRLLAWYPSDHRAVYGEEMLGVLMSASPPGQRRPGAREALNLVAYGLRARLRATVPALCVPAWRDAAAVFGFLASALTAVMFAYPAVADLSWRGRYVPPSRAGLVLAVGWTLVTAAAGLDWRRVAAAGAAIGLAGQAVAFAVEYADDPGRVVASWWRLVLAAAAAGALALRWQGAAGEQRASPLGVRSRVAVGVAAALAVAAPLVEVRTSVVTAFGDGSYSVTPAVSLPPALSLPLIGDRPFTLIGVLALLVTSAAVMLRLTPRIRRRVLLLAAPAAVVWLVVVETFSGFLASSPIFTPPVYLVPPQWIALAVTPVLTFTAGLWLLVRFERKLVSGELVR